MKNIIDEIEKQKESYLREAEEKFQQAKALEDVLAILNQNKPASVPATYMRHHKLAAHARAKLKSPVKSPYGTRTKVIVGFIENLIKTHGAMGIHDIQSRLVKAEILKRNAPSPSSYIFNSRKFIYDRATKLYSLKK